MPKSPCGHNETNHLYMIYEDIGVRSRMMRKPYINDKSNEARVVATLVMVTIIHDNND